MSFNVEQRTHEIGVRAAVGVTRRDRRSLRLQASDRTSASLVGSAYVFVSEERPIDAKIQVHNAHSYFIGNAVFAVLSGFNTTRRREAPCPEISVSIWRPKSYSTMLPEPPAQFLCIMRLPARLFNETLQSEPNDTRFSFVYPARGSMI